MTSHKCIFTHYQRNRVDNHTNHREFLAHLETLKTYGGIRAVELDPNIFNAMVKELHAKILITDPDNHTNIVSSELRKGVTAIIKIKN